MANPTMLKFGYPETLLAENEHWVLLLRPEQVTLGAVVLAHKGPEQAFGDLPPANMTALLPMVSGVERLLRAFVAYERINYLMLMMVDREVHFHVLPRYEGQRSYGGLSFVDAGWPGPPQLAGAAALPPDLRHQLVLELRARW